MAYLTFLLRQQHISSIGSLITVVTICWNLRCCVSQSFSQNIVAKPVIFRNLIINGENAPDKRYSFAQVSLMLNVANDESPYDHQCGGSIVAPGVILSAAHCRQWFSDIDIDRFNFVDRTDEYEVVHASNIIVHPSYESETYRYDYMLIQTDKQFSTSDAPPIRLNSDPNYPTGGQDLTVLGWGTTDHSDPNKPVFPSILQKGKLKYINNDECQSTVIANKALYEGEVFPEMLCAKSNRGVDACSGDSGGPLIVEGSDEGEDLLVGIVSWGRGCAIYPGVYSRISSGYSWIRTQICFLSYDPPRYLNCAASERNPTYLVTPTSMPRSPTFAPALVLYPTNEPIVPPVAATTIEVSPSSSPRRRRQPPMAQPLPIPISFSELLPSIPSKIQPTVFRPPSDAPSTLDASQKVAVLVELQLDGNSEETGWYISSEGGKKLFSEPAGTYADRPNDLVWEIVMLPVNQNFNFVITDSKGNGMCCSDGITGWFRLSLKIKNNFSADPTFDKKDNVVPILAGTGSFESIQSSSFGTTLPPDNSMAGAIPRKNDAGVENKEGNAGIPSDDGTAAASQSAVHYMWSPITLISMCSLSIILLY